MIIERFLDKYQVLGVWFLVLIWLCQWGGQSQKSLTMV
jgi:hypothetical protein